MIFEFNKTEFMAIVNKFYLRKVSGRIFKTIHLVRLFFLEILQRRISIVMSASFTYKYKLIKSNWGDDINWWFLNAIAEKPIVPYDWSWMSIYFKRESYQVIGSTLTLMGGKNVVVWGAGCIDSVSPISFKPNRVAAVRGPLTRARLLEQGIECPEVYGDPALLLPKYYRPQVTKKYKLGIIPHYIDKNNEVLNKINNKNEILIIDISKYDHWLDFVDCICMCENIASSSLHGLIISQAYEIPNCWIQFNKQLDEFKYHDFFLSQGYDKNVISINTSTNLGELLEECKKSPKSNYDIQTLIDAAPFKLKKNYKINR